MEVEEDIQQQQQQQHKEEEEEVRRPITENDFKTYYSKFFPFNLVYRWLAYNDASVFERREFACSIQAEGGVSVFTRYLSFSSPEEMRKKFVSLNPTRIEIGAIFSSPPATHDSAVSFSAVERELIFDIDMDAYDEVRVCCKGAKVCDKCWPLLNKAVKVMDTVLRECFGFNQLVKNKQTNKQTSKADNKQSHNHLFLTCFMCVCVCVCFFLFVCLFVCIPSLSLSHSLIHSFGCSADAVGFTAGSQTSGRGSSDLMPAGPSSTSSR